MTRNSLAIRLLLAGVGFFAGAAIGADIPDSIKTSADASKQRDQIQSFIREKTQTLFNGDPVARTAARESLIDNAEVDNSTASSAFKDIYAEELDNELSKAIKSGPMEGRLNAAIVTARVGKGDRNAQLADTAMAAMSDKSEPVMLWGVKAAAQLMPWALTASKNPPLLGRVTSLAASNPPARLVPDIYDALTLTSQSSDPSAIRDRISDAQWRTLAPLIAPELFKFWRMRLTQIAAGKADEPGAEIIPAKFIGVYRTWSALPLAQQQQAMQLLTDQLTLEAALAGGAAGSERDAYMQVLKYTAGALEVIGGSLLEKSQPLEAAGRAVRSLGGNAPADAIALAARQCVSAVKAMSKFSQLQPPPKLTAPTTKPS